MYANYKGTIEVHSNLFVKQDFIKKYKRYLIKRD